MVTGVQTVLFRSRFRQAQPDVLADGAVEQIGFLGHIADASTPYVQRDARQRTAVNQNFSGLGFVIAQQKLGLVTAGKLVRFQEGIIDMSGPGAEYTPYSQTCNVVLVLEPSDPNMDKHDYEQACRIAGVKAAAYLARCCADVKADKVEVYNHANIKEAMWAHPGLPKVGYIYISIIGL